MKTESLLETAVKVQQTAAAACRAAKEFERIGEYETAGALLAEWWGGTGKRPRIEGLPPIDQAELLLRAGTLTGWLGSARQIPGAQQEAKDLISESVRAFADLGYSDKIAEAETDLAICYWREGAMDEARVWFQAAMGHASEPVNQLRVLVNSTTVEISTNHLDEALSLLDRAAPLLDKTDDSAAVGRYYMQRGIILRRLGGPENLDRALIDHTAARVHFEKANHRRYLAREQNNIGVILLEIGRYDEALNYLEEARATFAELDDVGTSAQVNETRARVYFAQQRYADAEKLAAASAAALESGGEQSLLAEALQTQGMAQARQGRSESALTTMRRAAEVAEAAGDPESSGRTFLTMIEELKTYLGAKELAGLYSEADRRLGEDLSAETMGRLRACARLLAGETAITPGVKNVAPGVDAMVAPVAASPIAFSFEEEVRRCESNLIKQALDKSNGSVTRAAKMLGLTHQGLCYIINHRHKSLLRSRAPIRVRRKSVMSRH